MLSTFKVIAEMRSMIGLITLAVYNDKASCGRLEFCPITVVYDYSYSVSREQQFALGLIGARCHSRRRGGQPSH
jgi:hypothetical protein